MNKYDDSAYDTMRVFIDVLGEIQDKILKENSALAARLAHVIAERKTKQQND